MFSATPKARPIQQSPKCILPATQTPVKPPNQQPLPWGLAKSKSYVAAATVGSHEPELAVPRHPRAVPKSQPGHRPWEPGEDEGGGSAITSTLVIFFNSERFQNLSDTHVCNCRGLSHSMHVRRVGGGWGWLAGASVGAAGAAPQGSPPANRPLGLISYL